MLGSRALWSRFQKCFWETFPEYWHLECCPNDPPRKIRDRTNSPTTVENDWIAKQEINMNSRTEKPADTHTKISSKHKSLVGSYSTTLDQTSFLKWLFLLGSCSSCMICCGLNDNTLHPWAKQWRVLSWQWELCDVLNHALGLHLVQSITMIKHMHVCAWCTCSWL